MKLFNVTNALTLIRFVGLYGIAFKVSVPLASVMLVAHIVSEVRFLQEQRRQYAQMAEVMSILTGASNEEPPHNVGNC